MQPFSIYFPQFYPTPTNDHVWGKGFTDWVLLANSNLRIDDGDRRAPARGLYDGADPVIHHAQIAEMQAHGLGGIGLYHYWFHSHQELGAFEQTLLAGNDATAMPWFLIWATEGWTKRWIGDHTTIVGLDPDPDQTLVEAHCRHLARCFENPAYFRWQGRPLFVWYNLAHFTHPARLLDRYRAVLRNHGFDVAMANFVKNTSDIALCAHTDASYVFEPRMFFNMGRSDRGTAARFVFDRAVSLLGADKANRLLVGTEKLTQREGRLFRADAFLAYLASDARAELLRGIAREVQEVISPGWDNAPRYDRRFTALESLSGSQFGALVAAASASGTLPPLINAWNEWTEKAAIEPCAYLGTRYLDALQHTR